MAHHLNGLEHARESGEEAPPAARAHLAEPATLEAVMGKKCCVPLCRSGYDKTAAEKSSSSTAAKTSSSSKKSGTSAKGDGGGDAEDDDSGPPLSFHHFPTKDAELRQRWIQSIPRAD